MTEGPEDRSAAVPKATPMDDTIDLQLTEGEQRLLAEAAAVTPAPLPLADAPGRFEPASRAGEYIHRRTARIDLICTITFAAALLGVSAAAIWRPAAPRAPALAARAPAAHMNTPATATAALSTPTVRVQNPFDAAEVFQFPAGTSEVDAREAVASLLLERARERYDHGPGSRVADGADPHAPGTRPDILVSRLAEAESGL